MSRLTRRAMLGGGLVLGAGLGCPLAAQITSGSMIELPQGPMILCRRIERPLSDGAIIVVVRRWGISFSRSGRSIMVEGRQMDADVTAPEKLAALARIEKDRNTDGMFPILLSSDGMIIGTGAAGDSGDLAKAVDTATALVNQSDNPPEAKDAVLHYLAALRAAGSSVVETLPPDLFFPRGGDQRDLREISLPNGQLGEIELIRSVQLAPGKTWLNRLERRVVTRVVQSSQESHEIWTLHPAESG